MCSTFEYAQLIEAAKNYIGPDKQKLETIAYGDLISMLAQDEVKESTKTLLYALYMVDPTRRHLATQNFIASSTEKFVQAFTIKFYPMLMFFEHEREVVTKHIPAANSLVVEFESMLQALRDSKGYSFQTFWALLAEYDTTFHNWTRISKGGLPFKLQIALILVDRSKRNAEAANCNMGILGAIEARYYTLRLTLQTMPDGENLILNAEALMQLERKVYGIEPGFERRMLGIPELGK